jgi:cytochrome c peroxidase
MKKVIVLTATSCAIITFQFCSKKDNVVTVSSQTTTSTSSTPQPILPSSPLNYLVNYPAFIQTALQLNDNTPSDNPITNDGATLGRVLFYDTQLSSNNTISCGSCHQQSLSFDDTLTLSKGFQGGLTARNAMTILNIRFYKSGKMFWDERSLTAEAQALQPIQNHTEMGLTLAELESKVKALSYYPALFQKAFGSTTIDSIRIAKALAQFERSMVTYQSKYDRVKQGLESFTTAESAGEQFFNTAGTPPPGGVALSCNSCHTAPMFLNSAAPPFGIVDANDLGINNTGKFKSGSLRNIMIRKSLFHNGSVANVQAMLSSGTPGTGTAPIPAHSISSANIANVMAFMSTLTDSTILKEPKFSNPFSK